MTRLTVDLVNDSTTALETHVRAIVIELNNRNSGYQFITPGQAVASGAGRARGPSRGYYLKHPGIIDWEKKGGYRFTGDWCNRPSKEAEGTLLLVGVKGSDRRALVRVKHGAEAHAIGFSIPDCELLYEGDDLDAICHATEAAQKGIEQEVMERMKQAEVAKASLDEWE